MKLSKFFLITICPLVLLVACSPDTKKIDASKKQGGDINIWPKIVSEVKTDPAIEQQVDALLAQLTLEQKVAQMIQPEIRDITPADMRRYGFGSYLNGGGAFPNNNKHSTPADWINLAEEMYQASVDDSQDGVAIPTMWGTDAVHGHNNVIGATLFPHNIGLGAMNNPALMEKIAQITATEVMVTGIDWVFAPTVATVRDDRWGRTYEGYSEDPTIVKSYATAVVRGLQGHAKAGFLADNRVISTVKHFVGDGGTHQGVDQGDNQSSEIELFNIHAQGYVGGLTAGAQSVMASFNSWNGKKIHGDHYLLTQVLKERMGFDGFVVGDWNGHGQIKGCTNSNCPQAINAGLDVFMVPTDAWKPLMENTIEQVNNGEISMSRIDDAVRRILRVKYRAGLFNKPSPANRQLSGKTELIGHSAHRAVARQAVRESMVLLKNKGQLLPLSPSLNFIVAGDAAHNIGKQSGGWTITWQGTGNTNQDFPGGTSIYQGLAEQIKAAGGQVSLSEDGSYTSKPDVAIVVFGEEPYAEGNGDRDDLSFEQDNKKSLALLKKFKADKIPVVSLFVSGRPLWVNAELNASNAFVAVWLPGSEGGGIADVILRKPNGEIQFDFHGKLSYSWPNDAQQATTNIGDTDYAPLLPYGYGLTYQGDNNESLLLSDNLSETTSQSKSAKTQLTLFTNRVSQPWDLILFSDKKEIKVSSSVHQLSSLVYRTIDKDIQEDAFKILLTGQSLAGVRIQSKSGRAVKLNNNPEQQSALHFSFKLNSKPTSQVNLAIYCTQNGDCNHSHNITDYLNDFSVGQWETFSISLNCFSRDGNDLSNTYIPFEISSLGYLDISLTEIAWLPVDQTKPVIDCN